MKRILIAAFLLFAIGVTAHSATRPEWSQTTASSTTKAICGEINLTDSLSVFPSSASYTSKIKLDGKTGDITAKGVSVSTMTVSSGTITNLSVTNLNSTTLNVTTITASAMNASAISSGSLGSGVICSSLAVNSVYLQALVSTIQQALIPPGTLLMYSTTTAPSGYLYCNGAAVSTTTYSALYAVIGFKDGNPGSGNMNLPDMRGMFARGLDDGASRDPETTRVIGSTQTDTMQGHKHSTTASFFQYPSVGGSGGGTAFPLNSSAVEVTIGSPTTDGTNGTPRTANETRPENVAVAYIIKY